MDSNTFELIRALESGPYDEAGLQQVKRLLGVERRALRAKNDLPALEQLIPLLQQWAIAAGGGWLGASALGEAAEIAELDLRNSARAEELRTQAISTGRTASGTPIPLEAKPLSPELTQEMHTLDLEIAETPSLLPLPDDEALTAEIDRAEHALERDSSPERVRELAELYAKRGAPSDRENAAQLYCTLGEMLGNPAGVPMLERAIALIPEHAEAKALLMRFAVRPRRVSSPKITLLGVQPLPPRAIPQPPAAAGLNAPKSASGASTPSLPAASPPPAAGAAANPSFAPRPGSSGSLMPKTAAGAALSNAAARISSRPPGRTSSRPPGRRSSTSPGFATAAAASSALAADDHAIPLQTLPLESMPPLAVAAATPSPLVAAVAHEAADSHASVAAMAVPDLQPANDADAPQLDVLQLHGIPQVKTNPPSVPEISSLSPFERNDAADLDKRIPKSKRALIASGIALSAAAAFGIYIVSSSKPSASPKPTAASTPVAKTAAASQPQAAADTQPKPEQPQPAAAPEPAEPEAQAEAEAQPAPQPIAAKPKPETPAPLAPPAPSHLPQLKLEPAKLKGGKLNETQLGQALTKAEPKLLACYAQALAHKPKLKGKVFYSFTIRSTGKASDVKRASGTLKDEALQQCSTKVLENLRYPKPRSKSTQVKLGISYKRS